MSKAEMKQEVEKLGYQLWDTSEFEQEFLYRRNDSILYFSFSSDGGMDGKSIQTNEQLEEGKGLEDLLEKHEARYLEVVGINFDNSRYDIKEYNGVVVNFESETYVGELQVIIYEGRVYVTHKLRKR